MARSKTVRLDFSDRLEDPHRYVPKDHQQFTRFAEQVAKFLILDLSPIRAHQVYPLDSKLSGYVTVMEGLLRREDPMTRELILNYEVSWLPQKSESNFRFDPTAPPTKRDQTAVATVCGLGDRARLIKIVCGRRPDHVSWINPRQLDELRLLFTQAEERVVQKSV